MRFLYLHRPEWYLSINLEKKPDVLELPIESDLDVSGWDLRKALQLFYKSNPPLMEWLGSPIIYREQFEVAKKMRALAQTYYSPLSAAHHYLNMAKNNFRNYFKGPEVLHKKYFYVLRPLLAIQWLERKLGVVPTEFQVLLDTLVEDAPLKNTVEELMRQKSVSKELDKAAAIPVLNDFIEKELFRLEKLSNELPVAQASPEALDLLFQESLEKLWQPEFYTKTILVKDQKTSVELLKRVMSDLSEDYGCAGWLSDLEYTLWEAVIGKNTEPFSVEEIEQLRYLSEHCGGWIIWDGQDLEKKFIPMQEWLLRFEKYEKENE